MKQTGLFAIFIAIRHLYWIVQRGGMRTETSGLLHSGFHRGSCPCGHGKVHCVVLAACERNSLMKHRQGSMGSTFVWRLLNSIGHQRKRIQFAFVLVLMQMQTPRTLTKRATRYTGKLEKVVERIEKQFHFYTRYKLVNLTPK